VSVGSILNQSRLSSLGHHHSDLPEISFLFFSTRTPVNELTMLQLSVRNASFACGCFRASREATVQSASTFAFLLPDGVGYIPVSL
jgi:hypothetical protein